jgi:hypothetical protein
MIWVSTKKIGSKFGLYWIFPGSPCKKNVGACLEVLLEILIINTLSYTSGDEKTDKEKRLFIIDECKSNRKLKTKYLDYIG